MRLQPGFESYSEHKQINITYGTHMHEQPSCSHSAGSSLQDGNFHDHAIGTAPVRPHDRQTPSTWDKKVQKSLYTLQCGTINTVLNSIQLSDILILSTWYDFNTTEIKEQLFVV